MPLEPDKWVKVQDKSLNQHDMVSYKEQQSWNSSLEARQGTYVWLGHSYNDAGN